MYLRVIAAVFAIIILLSGMVGCKTSDKNGDSAEWAPQGTADAPDMPAPEPPPQAEFVIDNPITFGNTDVLILVNKENKLPDDYELVLMSDGAKYAEVLHDDFLAMRKAARAESVLLIIRDAYRTHEEQERIFAEMGERFAAPAGYSEHQTGLAIDFSYENMPEENTKSWEWLSKNAYVYGFILRYPDGKEHITGYAYEPWHYRYVGVEAAAEIYARGICLEEYLGEPIHSDSSTAANDWNIQAAPGSRVLPPVDQ